MINSWQGYCILYGTRGAVKNVEEIYMASGVKGSLPSLGQRQPVKTLVQKPADDSNNGKRVKPSWRREVGSQSVKSRPYQLARRNIDLMAVEEGINSVRESNITDNARDKFLRKIMAEDKFANSIEVQKNVIKQLENEYGS